MAKRYWDNEFEPYLDTDLPPPPPAAADPSAMPAPLPPEPGEKQKQLITHLGRTMGDFAITAAGILVSVDTDFLCVASELPVTELPAWFSTRGRSSSLLSHPFGARSRIQVVDKLPLSLPVDLQTLVGLTTEAKGQILVPFYPVATGSQQGSTDFAGAWYHVLVLFFSPAAMLSHQDFERFLADIDETLSERAKVFQKMVFKLENKSSSSFEGNRQIASLIQKIAGRLRVAFECPKCGEPARFKCAKSGTSKNGAFSFAHSGGTHGATNAIPKLILTKAPPDARESPAE